VTDPSTGNVLCTVADATPTDGIAALNAAANAQSRWAAYPPRDRGEILRRAYQLLIDRIDDLALLITLEMGKPLTEARAEIHYAAEFFRWFSEEAVRIDGQYSMAPDGDGHFLTLRQPVGPCLLITPWNFPMAMGTRKIGPAIAAGCTMVLKPAEQTPLSTLALVDILLEAGLPPEVLNVVTTSAAADVMEPLIRDGRARKLSFTGSTGVGQRLLAQASHQVLRTSMELGGNAPFLVFPDADLNSAVEGAVHAKLRNAGQACIAANRIYVHRDVAAQFTDRLVERMATLHVGRGTDAGVSIGPLIDDRALAKVSALVSDAEARGVKALLGGSTISRPGHFFEPTVLVNVPSDARICSEEIFGPVAPIVEFDTEEEVLELANSTDYGLVAYVYTTNLDRALRVSENLQTGMVGLNKTTISNPAAPFGGIKQSGIGREGGSVGIDEFLETKYVAVRTN
jgi:succinate-semialdehyde dehydrogenase/glutarate-semialdehyde dehydrogenase